VRRYDCDRQPRAGRSRANPNQHASARRVPNLPTTAGCLPHQTPRVVAPPNRPSSIDDSSLGQRRVIKVGKSRSASRTRSMRSRPISAARWEARRLHVVRCSNEPQDREPDREGRSRVVGSKNGDRCPDTRSQSRSTSAESHRPTRLERTPSWAASRAALASRRVPISFSQISPTDGRYGG
jgi:hypothetical protein